MKQRLYKSFSLRRDKNFIQKISFQTLWKTAEKTGEKQTFCLQRQPNYAMIIKVSLRVSEVRYDSV
jgi:hypothetical protein